MTDLVERLRFDVGSRPGGICEEAANEIERLRGKVDLLLVDLDEATRDSHKQLDEIERLRAEVLEQCRLNGMGGSREAKLIAENAQLRARVAELEAERRRPCGDVQDCIWQPRCGMARRCLRPSGGLIAPIDSLP